MKIKNKEWKPKRAKYGIGEELWIGRRCVGAWFNPTVSKGSPSIYRAVVHLPDFRLKEDVQDKDNRDDAKLIVERSVDAWFASVMEE